MAGEANDNSQIERQLAYYKKRLDEQAGKLLEADYAASALRHELLQKRRGFALLGELQQRVAGLQGVAQVFESVVEAVNTELGMDRTAVLRAAEKPNTYRATYALGLPPALASQLETLRIELPEEFADGTGLMVINKASPSTAIIEQVRQSFDLPFFIGIPVMGDGELLGILLTGRTKEVRPLYPPFDKGDVETFRAIAGLISATVKNMRVSALQEMDRLKTQFFANISHEFRTPITLTLGPLEGMLTGRYGHLSDENRQQVEVMARNQQRLLGLVNQILDLAKMESGDMPLHVSRFRDLNHWIAQVVAQFESLAKSRGLTLRTELDPAVTSVPLYADQEKIERLLFNLLSNAHKFTKRGSIVVTSTLDEDHVVLSVQDSGIGIRDDQIPFIFDRFRQADGSESREYAGTGLGLSLVAEIAKLHGGSVQVQSRYGEGTTFRVRLPIGQGSLPEGAKVATGGTDRPAQAQTMGALAVHEGAEDVSDEASHMNKEARATWSSTKATVLYADDNSDLRAYVRGLLMPEYNVLVATDGRDALQLAQAQVPDLILSDVMMPRMGGRELCAEVRKLPELDAIPVVLLTAKSTFEDKLEGLEGGADDYLSKPFRAAELLARVRNLVTMRRQHLTLKRELAAAREIQRALLPAEDAKFGRATTSVLFRPCGELSGDFFDIVYEERILFFYLADVTSHGTAAAQATYLVREAFRKALSHGMRLPLAETVEKARDAYASYGVELDVGFHAVRLDLATGNVELARGNAPPAIRIRANGHDVWSAPVSDGLSRRWAGHGTAQTQTLTRMLSPGDRLFLFTDGAYEFSVKNRAFGMKRLATLLAQVSQVPDNDWRTTVWQTLKNAALGQRFRDDVSVFCVEFEASEPASNRERM